jgi:hypothetical protein
MRKPVVIAGLCLIPLAGCFALVTYLQHARNDSTDRFYFYNEGTGEASAGLGDGGTGTGRTCMAHGTHPNARTARGSHLHGTRRTQWHNPAPAWPK